MFTHPRGIANLPDALHEFRHSLFRYAGSELVVPHWICHRNSARQMPAWATLSFIGPSNRSTMLKVRGNILIGTPPARFFRVKVTAAP